jgi:serralysin
MKLSFLSKSLTNIGLMAALSATVGPSIAKSVQAQTQPPATSQAEVNASNANLSIAAIIAQSGGEYDDNNQDFDIFLNALKETELSRGLEESDVEGTVFAPTDEAFLKLSRFFGYGGNDEAAVLDIINQKFAEFNKNDVASGGNNPNRFNLRDVLLYHLSDGVKTSANLQNLKGGKLVRTMLLGGEGGDPFLRAFPFNYVNGNLIDGAPNLVDPKLVPGLTDISASNGIIQGIDHVLMPYFITPTSPMPTAQAGQPVTIADMIAQSGEFDDNNQDFDILFKLIQTAGLTEALADPNADLTLFAPTDAAFMKLDQFARGGVGPNSNSPELSSYSEIINFLQQIDQTVKQLPLGVSGDAVSLLQTVLKYHVSAGAQTAAEIQAAPSIDTLLEGEAITPKDRKLVDLSPEYADPQFQAGKTDMTASNGVIHGIDNVLIPKLF